MNYKQLALLSLLIALLASCSQQRYTLKQDRAPLNKPDNILATPDAIPVKEPKSRGGNPPSYTVFGKTYYVLESSQGFSQQGIASWYGSKFHGHKTSNGETYNMYAMSAAHKNLPLPTYLEVSNLENGKKITVRVNDRGPFHANRIIDLSYAAAAKLGVLDKGTARVAIRALNPITAANKEIPNTQAKQQAIIPMLYLQAGAFSKLENASLLENKLTLAEIKAPRVHEKAGLYLLQIGPYQSLEEAEHEQLKLQKLGISNSHYIYR